MLSVARGRVVDQATDADVSDLPFRATAFPTLPDDFSSCDFKTQTQTPLMHVESQRIFQNGIAIDTDIDGRATHLEHDNAFI